MKPWMIDPQHPKFWKPTFIRRKNWEDFIEAFKKASDNKTCVVNENGSVVRLELGGECAWRNLT
jgi:hypothetical protein